MNDHITENKKEDILEMTITNLEVGAIERKEGFYPIILQTSRGTVEGRYHAAAERKRAVIFVGSAKGGWESPVRGLLYTSLSHYLARHDINCLHIRYRYPGNLAESILDILAGISFLAQDGITSIGLVGHAFGGAAVIQAAAASPYVSTVVSLSPQTFGAEAVDAFRTTQSIMIVHGSDETVFPVKAGTTIYEYAHDPKKIILYKGANHNLDQAGPEVFVTVRDWLIQHVHEVQDRAHTS